MKRTNEKYSEIFLVASGNQAMAKSGNISSSGTSVNIANGQLGVIAATAAQPHLNQNDFLGTTNNPAGSAANTNTDVPAIRIVQGTPSSADTSQLYGWFYEDPAYVKSPIIRSNTVKSFTAQVAATPVLSSKLFSGLVDANVLSEKEYTSFMEFRSRRNDRDFGANVEQLPTVITTPDFSVVTVDSKLDWLVTQFVHNMNLNSKLYNNPSSRGNKDFVAFAINTAGSNTGGTVIGTLEVGDTIPFLKVDGVTYSTTVTKAMLETLNQLITNSTVTASSTIETVDLDLAGDGTLATGVLTATGNFTANDTVTIGGQTYTFVAAPASAYDVDLGGDLATSLSNLASAVNADGTAGAYGAGTVANPDVTATSTATTVTVTAVQDNAGTTGNSIVFTEGTDAGGVFSVSGSGTLEGATNTNKDKFMIVGLPQRRSVGHDGIAETLVRVDVQFGEQFQIAPKPTTTNTSNPFEGYGQGTLLRVRYDRRAFGYTGSMQQTGHADEVILSPNYIDKDTNYTAYIIDFSDSETTITVDQNTQKRIWILVPATDDSNTATAADGITESTNAATTVADLEAILKPWLSGNVGIQLLGDATASTYFA